MFVLTLIVIVFALSFYYVKHAFSFWKRNGIPQDIGNRIPLGCLTNLAKLKKSAAMCVNDAYMRNKNPFVGIYILFGPVFMARDIDLVRHILVKNFNNFHDRGIYDGSESDPLSSTLFTQTGQTWRSMRHRILPSFTAGKLKAMFQLSIDVADKMINHMNSILPDKGYKQIDLRKITDTYSLDIVGSTIFGLDLNSFANPKNEFKTIIGEVMGYSIKNAINTAFLLFSPSLAAFCKRIGFENKAIYSLRRVVQETVEYREKHNITRKDILQLLMQLRSQGEISADDNTWDVENKSSKDLPEKFNIDNITAQSFVFLVAGQETTSATSSFTIFELAQNPEVLEKAQQEVIELVDKNNGLITYETLSQMHYLELCLQETLRKYPGLPVLNRICTDDFNLPGTDITIKKGTQVVIPVYAIHNDPQHFPDPEKYMPERFTDSARSYNPDAYMPFGDGPRICIARRMGIMNTKLAVAKMLYEFNIGRLEKQEIEVSVQSASMSPKGGIHVSFSKRKTNKNVSN